MATKRILIAGLALAGVAGIPHQSFSADMPPGALVTKAPAAIAYRWTGCFIGANVGGASDRANFTDARSLLPSPLDAGSQRATNVLGGGQIGCDYQAGGWVFGVQG